MTVSWPRSVRKRVCESAVSGYPNETCGTLIGLHRSGETQAGETRVLGMSLARNLDRVRARDRYLLDPLDLLGADESARARGHAIVGIWHTHPDHPAEPSETDRKAAWEGWSYVILAVSDHGVEDVRSWRLVGGRFEEEALREEPE